MNVGIDLLLPDDPFAKLGLRWRWSCGNDSGYVATLNEATAELLHRLGGEFVVEGEAAPPPVMFGSGGDYSYPYTPKV